MGFANNTPSLQYSIIPFRLAELPQKPQIILKEQPNVVDTVLQHGDALDAHAKGEPGKLFGIITDEFEYRRIDHAGAQDFQPAAGFADAAALTVAQRAAAAANDALDIDLGAGLGEWKKTRPETHSSIAIENLPQHMGQHAL